MSDPGTGMVKVLSIVGAGRSGTTILAHLLGEIEGVASAGELRWLWERGLGERRPCGCGQEPRGCPVWSTVVDETLAALSTRVPRSGVPEVVAAQREIARRRHLPRLLRSVDGTRQDWPALELVRQATGTALTAFAAVSRADVVVDTSKRPLDAAVIAGLPDVEHYVVHLVRDPRAVVHSWRRSKSFTAAGRTRTMGTRGMAPTVRRWLDNCLTAEALRRRLPPARWLHLRYEDFAADPRGCVEAIVALVGAQGAAPFLDDHTVVLHPNHIVAGNPSRFTTGTVTIRADDAWRRDMPRRDQLLVRALTWPVMVRHGYPVAMNNAQAVGPELPPRRSG